MINLDEYKLIETHWIDLYMNSNNATNLDSFKVGWIPKEIKKITGNKNITTTIYRMQTYDVIMYCTEFIDITSNDKRLMDFINLFF